MGAMRKTTPLLGAVTALAAACTGTSTDNPYQHGNGSEHAGGSHCEERRVTELELDEQSELGFSADDVLTHLSGTREEVLAWQPLSGGSYGPESGTQDLTLSVAATGKARFVDYEPKSQGIELATQCDDQVEIPVEVTLKSAQGALDEHFTTTVRARSEAVGRIYHRLKASDIEGAFTLTAGNGFTLTELSIAIEATRFGTTGTITPSLEKQDSGSVAQSSSSVIASWGPRGCDQGGTPVPRDAAIRGFSADDVLSSLSQHGQSNARWSSGSDTNVTLSFAPSSEGACAVLEEDSLLGATAGALGSLRVPGTLTIVSADGRIDGSLNGFLMGVPDDAGELGSVRFDGSADDATNLTNIDLSAYDSARVQAMLALVGDSWSGSITLVGYDLPNCSTEVEHDPSGGASVPGCPGADLHEVAELLLGE